jgi:hypothetical protein
MELSKVALLRKADPKKGQSQRGMSDAFVISDIAERAAGGYDKAIDGAPEIYAKWVIDEWYHGDFCPEFMKEPHYRWVLREYSFKIADEIVRWIARWEKLIAEYEV